ncbi:MAG: serine/threonine protein kinase, partial [Planctomycetota bacterium]
MARRKSIWPPGRCMFCGEEAPDSALKCQHCGKVLLQASATRREENLTEADFAVSLQPGDVLAGRYRLLGELGGGITGRVWTAESLRGITTVCLRILPPILARDDVRVAGLKRDVAIALKLSHSNICGLRAFESDGEISFLAMEYVPGRTLSRMLDAKPGRRMSLEEAVCIARGIAKALDYGHSQSPPILHGDVKPSNIIVTPEGQPKLLGYVVGRELARAVMSVTGLEIPRRVLYTSPEAHAGQAETSASDVYSFAAVLYDCLAGHPPFWEGVVGDQLLNQEPPKIPELPKLVNGVLLAALAKTPAIRPRRASEVVQRIAVVPAAGPRVEAPAARAPARRQRAGPSDKPRPYLALRRPAEPLVGAPLVWERLGYAGLIAVGVVAFGFFVAAFIAPTVRGRGPLADRQAGVPAKEAAGGPVEKAAPKTEDGAEPMPPADAEAARPAKPLPQRDVATSAARDEGAAATVPGKRPVAEVREQPRVAAAGKRSLRPDSEAPGSPRPVQQLPARSGAFRADGPSEPAPPSREQLLWKLAAEYQGNVDRIHQEERALYEQRAAPLRVLYTYNEDFSACYRNIPGAREQVAALR